MTRATLAVKRVRDLPMTKLARSMTFAGSSNVSVVDTGSQVISFSIGYVLNLSNNLPTYLEPTTSNNP